MDTQQMMEEKVWKDASGTIPEKGMVIPMDDKHLQDSGEHPQVKKFELKIDKESFEEYGSQPEPTEPDQQQKAVRNPAEHQAPPDLPEPDEDGDGYEDEDEYDDEDGQEPRQDSRPQPRKKKKQHKALGIIVRVVIAMVILGFCAALSMLIINASGDIFGLKESKELKEISIEPDSSITQIAETLRDEGIIQYPDIFRLYIKYRFPDAVFNFGKYNLHPAMAYDELIEELQKSANSDHVAKVTFKEGQNVFEYAQSLQDAGVCAMDDFLAALNGEYPEYPFIPTADSVSPLRMYRLEGYLFPDTYEFYLNADARQVVTTFLDNFGVKFSAEMQQKAAAMNYTIDQIVSLASIVQAEAPVADQMEMVASVYWNRLNNPGDYPKMQSDPTARYANRFLQPNGASQEVVDAYNTYSSQGLPVGPINNPGLAALKATLYPANTGYYFFCTNLDTQEFYYAKTYEEHQKNLSTAGLTE